ncbi:GRP family sugar transporter [Neisseria perflava]|uniref:GRP family sugar transporter n=1 Tax=Neisseria perflava TaxID=33053 RepID=UPI0020A181B2|nr:GRP family sugar transporter [Neisseria perflava]MCP1659441.1 glucose uptake protein [Neisseria perflava]MCP1772281.1 glucose uptake protein [Neisseria perflava]
MDFFLALLPALFWGSMILFTVYIGGTAYSQLLGITVGALLFAVVNYAFSDPVITTKVFWVGLASGALWSVGQIGQLQSIKKLGAATTMPISTGMQLIATTLFGALVLSEWHNAMTTGLGLAALLLILAGVFLTSARAKNAPKDAAGQENMRGALVMLAVSTAGYLAYAVLAAFFKVKGSDAILPQSIGMVLMALLLTVKERPYNKDAFKNILPGIVWALGSFFMFLAQPRVGVAISFSLAQVAVAISTLGSIFILKEHKTPDQMKKVILGIVLIVLAAVLLGIAKNY